MQPELGSAVLGLRDDLLENCSSHRRGLPRYRARLCQEHNIRNDLPSGTSVNFILASDYISQFWLFLLDDVRDPHCRRLLPILYVNVKPPVGGLFHYQAKPAMSAVGP
jgi:hypothetical protein